MLFKPRRNVVIFYALNGSRVETVVEVELIDAGEHQTVRICCTGDILAVKVFVGEDDFGYFLFAAICWESIAE